MLRTKFIALVIILLTLTSCDSSLMGSFLHWCWIDNRDVNICYGNDGGASSKCGASSNITTVVTVNAIGNYGSNNTVPPASQSQATAACNNIFNTCQSNATVQAYTTPQQITFNVNKQYNYVASGKYTSMNCNLLNPFQLQLPAGATSCTGPNSANPDPTVTTPCSCDDPKATTKIAGVTCDTGDATQFTNYCTAYQHLYLGCMTAYQNCTAAIPPPTNNAYGQWVSTNLQITANETVTMLPSKTTGTITLTQPLGLRPSSNTNTYAAKLQAYQKVIQTCITSGTCPCPDLSSDFCLYQACFNYDQKTLTTDPTYLKYCDCSPSGSSPSSNFCLYGDPSGNKQQSSLSDYANGGKGVLIPFYFDPQSSQLNIVSSDPAVESISTLSGEPLTQGFNSIKMLTNSVRPNQTLTFTVDPCNVNLTAPYSIPNLASNFPYGAASGWAKAYYQLRTAQENFNIGTATAPNNVPIDYQYWGAPIAGSQCNTSCSAAAPGNFNSYKITSAASTFTSDISGNYSPNSCWSDKAQNIQFQIGSNGSWTDLSPQLQNNAGHWSATVPVGQSVNGNNLSLRFNSNFQIPDPSAVIAAKSKLDTNLCSILSTLEPGKIQPSSISSSGCVAQNDNPYSCYMLIDYFDVHGKQTNSMNSNMLSNIPASIQPYAETYFEITDKGFRTTSYRLRYQLYCWQQQQIEGDNCIDIYPVYNNNVATSYDPCITNGGKQVLRGFTSYSCCFTQENAPKVIAGLGLRQSNLQQADIDKFWGNTSYTPSTYPLQRINDLAGLCDGNKAQCQDSYNYSQKWFKGGLYSTCFMGNNNSTSITMVKDPSRLGFQNTSLFTFDLHGDYYPHFTRYLYYKSSKTSSVFPEIQVVIPGINGFYADASPNSRQSLNKRRSCFPYWNGANKNDVPGGCPKVLGSRVEKVCSNPQDPNATFACCYDDEISLTVDNINQIEERKQMVANNALVKLGPDDTGSNNRAIQRADLVGGVNLYVKSVPIEYTNGQKLLMTISHDDPNFSDPKTLPTGGFTCPAGSDSCTPAGLACPAGKGCAPSGSGTIWLKIDDSVSNDGDGYYLNNTGSYDVTLKVTQSTSTTGGGSATCSNGGLFGNLICQMKHILQSAIGKIYNAFTHQGEYMRYVSFLCQMYIILTVFNYILGITKYNQLEFLIKIIKLCVVVSCLRPEFSNFLINVLPQTVWDGQGYLIAAATGNAAGSGSDFNPFYMFNQVFEFLFVDLGSLYRLVALLGVGLGGVILVCVIIACCFYYIFAVIDSLKAYLIAIFNLSLMFAMAPLFIPFILFSKTREMFDSWIKHILQYMLEPVLLFSGLTFLSTMLLVQLTSLLSDGVCLKCVISFIIGISSVAPFNNLMDVCIPGLLPYAFDNQGEGLMSFYFTQFGEAAFLLILALVLKGYVKFINDVSLSIVSAGGRSVTGATNYKNLMDGGSNESGSLASFQKATGLSMDEYKQRRQELGATAVKNIEGTAAAGRKGTNASQVGSSSND